MQQNYSKKIDPIQKASKNTASSVLDASSQSEALQRKANMANNAAQREEAPRPNNTGMPDNLKSGIESLSGFSMDDVRVHYNSSKPATVQALAYTQGTDIHVAPGQEKHLPHEAWHVAQQMAGRVSPTTNINGMPVNDNAGLEHEADVMGEKAVQCKFPKNIQKNKSNCETAQMMTSASDFESKYVNSEEINSLSINQKTYEKLRNFKPSPPDPSSDYYNKSLISIFNIPCTKKLDHNKVLLNGVLTAVRESQDAGEYIMTTIDSRPFFKYSYSYQYGEDGYFQKLENTPGLYHVFYHENGSGNKIIEDSAINSGKRRVKEGTNMEIGTFKDLEKGLLIGEKEDILLVSHGSAPSFFFKSQFADYSAKNLAKKIFKILPNGYNGLIYLDGCYTGKPYKKIDDGTSFAERFGNALVKLASLNKKRMKFRVKGNLGSAGTNGDGKEAITIDNDNISIIATNIHDRWEKMELKRKVNWLKAKAYALRNHLALYIEGFPTESSPRETRAYVQQNSDSIITSFNSFSEKVFFSIIYPLIDNKSLKGRFTKRIYNFEYKPPKE